MRAAEELYSIHHTTINNGLQRIPSTRPGDGRLHRRVHGDGRRATRDSWSWAWISSRYDPEGGTHQGWKLGRNYVWRGGQDHAWCKYNNNTFSFFIVIISSSFPTCVFYRLSFNCWLQVTHWQHPRFHAYFPSGNSFPSILGDMLSDGIGCIGFSWVSVKTCSYVKGGLFLCLLSYWKQNPCKVLVIYRAFKSLLTLHNISEKKRDLRGCVHLIE